MEPVDESISHSLSVHDNQMRTDIQRDIERPINSSVCLVLNVCGICFFRRAMIAMLVIFFFSLGLSKFLSLSTCDGAMNEASQQKNYKHSSPVEKKATVEKCNIRETKICF